MDATELDPRLAPILDEDANVDLGWLTGPLPTLGDPYLTALAAVQELESRISTARFLLDVAPEEIEPIIADLTVRLDDRKAGLTRATRDREAASAYSQRMRGSTTSVRVITPRGPRARGAGRPAVRGSSRRSSAKSGDSGSEDGESEPPPAGRRCACLCGADISQRAPQARYLNDAHAAADRQRRKRERDLLNGVPGLARPCRCKPKRNPIEPGVCWQCGRARGQLTDDWVNDPGPSSRQLVIRDLTRRKWRTGSGKRPKVKHRKMKPRQEVVA